MVGLELCRENLVTSKDAAAKALETSAVSKEGANVDDKKNDDVKKKDDGLGNSVKSEEKPSVTTETTETSKTPDTPVQQKKQARNLSKAFNSRE